MNCISKLCDLSVGEIAKVSSIDKGCNIKRRLSDIGLIRNTEAKCVGISSGKHMRAYLIRGAVIAIRDEDAAYVSISKTRGELT